MAVSQSHLNTWITTTHITTQKQALSLLPISQRSSTLSILRSFENLLWVMVGLVWAWLVCQSMVQLLGSILMDHCLLIRFTQYIKDFIMKRIWSTFLIFSIQQKPNRKTTLMNSEDLKVCWWSYKV